MTTAVANAPQKQGLSTVRGWLESDAFKGAIAKALPSHMTPDRFLRIAVTATMRTPKLLQCTQESLFGCLLALSQYGLEPDGRRAHLIPFENKRAGTTECTLIIDYKGLAELVMRSGLVSSIHADVVCEHDDFEYDKGYIVRHRINFKEPRGEAYAAYAVVKMKDGAEKCEVLTKDEIYSIRNRGQGWQAFVKGWAKQSPWDPKEPVIEREMWKKTAFRRVSKWVPLSAEIRDALQTEDDAEEIIRDIGPAEVPATAGQSKSDQLAEMLAARMESQQADHAPPDDDDDNSSPPPESLRPAVVPPETPGAAETEAVPTADPHAEWLTKIDQAGTLNITNRLEDEIVQAVPMPDRQRLLDAILARRGVIRAARGRGENAEAPKKGELV